FVAFSGGVKVLVSDLAHEVRLGLPELSPRTEEEVSGQLGVGTSVGNPLDAGWGGLSSQETYLRCVNALLDDPGIDMLAIQEELPQSEARPDKESNLLALARIAEKNPKPIAVFSIIAQGVNDYGRRFKERCRLPFLEGAQNTVRALKHFGFFGEAVRKYQEGGSQRTQSLIPLGPIERRLLTTKKVLNEWESYQLVGQFGLPVAESVLATSLEEAEKAAVEMGYPVVVKLVAPGITHKTELGAVRVNLTSTDEITHAWKEIEAVFKRTYPDGQMDGFLVQKLVLGGVETIIGTVNDPVFGPAVIFGLGGQNVEVYQDVVFRMAPVKQEEAEEMICSIKGFPILSGFRGNPPMDLKALSRVIVLLSELAIAGKEMIQSIDLNPFISLNRGGMAVDASIITLKRES
ncbi:MAG: acetate--CoA ligase family protein, partial [Candidatus Binatia bacterium]